MLSENRRRWLQRAGKLIAVAALGKLQATARAEDLLDFTQLQPQSPAKAAPAAQFQTADGPDVTLASHLGKGIVLNFWATWCPPCVAELPSLDRLAASLAGGNIVVLAVSEDLGDKAAIKVKKYYDQHNIAHLPVLIDHHGTASDAFNNQGVPTTWLIDAKGQLRAKFEGGTDWSDAKAVAKVKELIG